MLFAGTGHGFFYSTDDGAHWTSCSAGLPRAPVSWVVVQKQFHDVVVSTYGRGLYVLDDITPLEQATPATTDAAAHLFAPRPAYRWSQRGRALINFSLKAAPRDAVQLQVARRRGQGRPRSAVDAARRAEPRAWDLRYEAAAADRDADDAAGEPAHLGGAALPRTGHAAGDALGARRRRRSARSPCPGEYTVKLTVDGQSSTQPIEILKDPKIATSVADLDSSAEMQLRLRDDISATADMVNTIECRKSSSRTR